MIDNETAKHTREWWDKRAEAVEDLPEVVGVGRYELQPATTRFLDDTVVRMLSSASGRGICMDGGCGVGLAFPIIHRVFPRILGLDFSPNVIRRIPEGERDAYQVQLCNGSITALPLADGSLDAVHCRDLLQCLPATDVVVMFKEFHRVLQPGGVAVVHFKNSRSMLHRIARLASRVKRLGRRPPPVPDPLSAEIYVPGDTYLRPWPWYLDQARQAGLKVEKQFSWQLFFWGRLKKRGLASPMERFERVLRKLPFSEPLIRHDGINYYVLLRKTV